MFLIYVYVRATKRIPSKLAEWMHNMQRTTGAVFFVLAGYTNTAGGLVVSRSVPFIIPEIFR